MGEARKTLMHHLEIYPAFRSQNPDVVCGSLAYYFSQHPMETTVFEPPRWVRGFQALSAQPSPIRPRNPENNQQIEFPHPPSFD